MAPLAPAMKTRMSILLSRLVSLTSKTRRAREM
jgi:hypothetical protein